VLETSLFMNFINSGEVVMQSFDILNDYQWCIGQKV